MRLIRSLEWWVGSFLLLSLFSLLILAVKVSGLTHFFEPPRYHLIAEFDEIGQLKIRAPVKMSGVPIGEVSKIELNKKNYKAIVTLSINQNMSYIPDDSSIQILTSGLLGDNYLSITPMYSEQFMKEGGHFTDVQSAIVLEKLIGQLIFKLGGSSQNQNNVNTKTEESINENRK